MRIFCAFINSNKGTRCIFYPPGREKIPRCAEWKILPFLMEMLDNESPR